jgi:tetratricopeptide (TPR) repeat protein
VLAPRLFAAYLPFAAVAVVYAAARVAALGRAGLFLDQPVAYDLLGRLVSAAHNAVVSLDLLIRPVRFHHLITTLPGDSPHADPLPEGLAAVGFAGLAIAIGGGWICLVRRAPRGAFAWLAAVVTWLPPSGLYPAEAGVALRFLLLPSAFAACGAAIALAAAVRARPALRPLAAGVVCLAVGAGAAATLRRLPAWRDNGAFFESVRAEVPDSYGALVGLGHYLQTLPEPDHVYVRSLYHRAIEVAPDPAGAVEALLNLAYSYATTGEIANALATYADAIAAAPNHFEPRLARAMVFAELGRTQDALADFDRALALNPALPGAECLRESIRSGERPWRRLPSPRHGGASPALPPEDRCSVASAQAE